MPVATSKQLHLLLERIRTGNVLAPLLAIMFIVGLFALSATWALNDAFLVRALWAAFLFCGGCALVAYLVWSIVDPDRLQSEDYRIARHRIDVIGDERNPNSAQVVDAVATENTHLTAYQKGGQGSE
jgi:phage shock protein PspC (stress-responsive transcriptional regulator)